MKIIIEDGYQSQRIDAYLVSSIDLSRSKISQLITEGKILVNNEPVKKNHKLAIGDEIEVLELKVENQDEILPENIPLEIVFEDEYLVVINKPSGMVVHPSIGHYSGTLVNALMYHFKNNLSEGSDETRPGIVHRIDKDTSGLLVVAKDNKTHELLGNMLKDHLIEREYYAIVHNGFDHKTGKIDAPIQRSDSDRKKYIVGDKNAKKAVTNFEVMRNNKEYALLRLNLETGRTHQIRVHMNWIKHPILNDASYGRKKEVKDEFGQYLHAKRLNFTHPITHEEINVECALPKEFSAKLIEVGLDV